MGSDTGGFIGQMYHNTVYTQDLIDNVAPGNLVPNRGTADNERVGDTICSTSITLKGAIQLAPERRNVTVKMYLLEYNSAQGTPNTYADFYQNVTGQSNLDPLNWDRWKPRYLGTVKCDSRDVLDTVAGAQDRNLEFSFKIPFKRTLQFNATSNQITTGMKERLTIVHIAFDNLSSSGATSIVKEIRARATLHYKDP